MYLTVWVELEITTQLLNGENAMKITKWDEQAAEDIGHAFGYYDYGQETGMGVFYSSKEAVANYIAGYVRMAFEGQKMNLKAGMAILKALFRNMSLKEMIRMGKALSKGGKSLQDRMKKEKKDFIFVGMVCVREQYQGQGYMRKVLDMAFSEGNRLHVPVILETDAKSKCDKYMHLGMELEGVRYMGAYGKMYDLIKYPN